MSTLTISLDGLPRELVPSASRLSNFLRITGGSFATSLTTTFWDRREALHQSRLAETTTLFDRALHRALSILCDIGATDLMGEGVLTGELVRQSYLLSSLDLFYLSGLAAARTYSPVLVLCGGQPVLPRLLPNDLACSPKGALRPPARQPLDIGQPMPRCSAHYT